MRGGFDEARSCGVGGHSPCGRSDSALVRLNSERSFDFNEAGIWIVLLISVFPGILLVASGILLNKAKKYGIIDFVVLAGSIIMFFILTTVLMGPSGEAW